MPDDTRQLCCPKCSSREDEFRIAATVWITVSGSDALTIIDEDGDREYGSEEPCQCRACGHQARMGDFYKCDQEVNMTPEQKAAAVEYAQTIYCDDDINVDADKNSPDDDFSEGDDGVWVRGWLFVPASEIPDYKID